MLYEQKHRTNNVDVFKWASLHDEKAISGIYEVDENKYIYRLLSHFNGESNVKHNAEDKTYTLSWNYGILNLPEISENGGIYYREHKCLYFTPIMRDFLKEQANFDIDKAKRNLHNVKAYYDNKWLFVFDCKDNKINLKPNDNNDTNDYITGKYLPVQISKQPFSANNCLNEIGQDMVGENILKIDPEAENTRLVESYIQANAKKLTSNVKKIASKVKSYVTQKHSKKDKNNPCK